MNFEYDVALTFAGEDRELVNALVLALVKRSIRVFYDDHEKDALWGKDLVEALHDMYTKRSRYCIMVISKHYVEKRWPKHERRSALERQLTSDAEYILPLRLDDTDVPGLPTTIAYVRMASENIDEIADLVLRKLGRTAQPAGGVPEVPVPLAPADSSVEKLLDRHMVMSRRLFPARESKPYYAIHTAPTIPVKVERERLEATFLSSKPYSEVFNYSDPPATHPDGYTRSMIYRVGGRPEQLVDAITCYRDGHLVSEGIVDNTFDGRPAFNPTWFIYEVQRHLQLAKELLDSYTAEIDIVVHLANINEMEWPIFRGGQIWRTQKYAGYHRDIALRVPLAAIHGRDRWNQKMDVAVAVMEDIARVFGFDRLPQAYWDKAGNLEYAMVPGR